MRINFMRLAWLDFQRCEGKSQANEESFVNSHVSAVRLLAAGQGYR